MHPDRCAYACPHALGCLLPEDHDGNHAPGCEECAMVRAHAVVDGALITGGVAQNAGAADRESAGRPGACTDRPLQSQAALAVEERPSILVSFAYRKPWASVRDKHRALWREVVLDSGVYTYRKKGQQVDLGEFCEWAQAELAHDPRVTEVFTVDQGGWKQGLKNTEWLWARGVRAMPVFHVGDPTEALLAMARDYPKIAIGGSVGYRNRMEWAALCFRHVWPKAIHGLGYGETACKRLPFHTVDNSSWALGPRQYGDYHSMNTAQLRGKRVVKQIQHVRGEVDFFLKEEARLRSWWAGRLPPGFDGAPAIRLATTCDAFQMGTLAMPPGSATKGAA